jgi:hypothetical protein
MKFSGFLKFVFLTSMPGILALVGCGGSDTLALTEGNWSVAATSNVGARDLALASFYIGGNLKQSGSTVSGSMYVVGSGCFPASQLIDITGTVKGKKVTLTTAAFQEQVVTVTATGTDSSTLTGTYSIAGGLCDGDQGTVSAAAVPAITGTWNGLVNPIGPSRLGISQATLSIALTQAATPSEDGTFALTGTVTFTNSNCSVSGTITGGSVAGLYVPFLDVDTVEQGGGPGHFQFSNALLDSASAPKNLTGDYDVSAGLCLGNDTQSVTFTKQ